MIVDATAQSSTPDAGAVASQQSWEPVNLQGLRYRRPLYATIPVELITLEQEKLQWQLRFSTLTRILGD